MVLQVSAFKSALINGTNIIRNLIIPSLLMHLASTEANSENPNNQLRTMPTTSKILLLKTLLLSSVSTCKVAEVRLFHLNTSIKNFTKG